MNADKDLVHIEEAKADFRENYQAAWRAMLDAWQSPGKPDMAWLMYAASYLFNTGGVRWALDPVRPNSLLHDLPADVQIEALKSLSFILLTHIHSDHYDTGLLAAIADGSVRLVVPAGMLENVMRKVRPDPAQVIVARPGGSVAIDGIRIEFFSGWHGSRLPDTVLGYCVELNGRRFLFPGDVREYDAAALKPFAPVDCVFAHIWFGRGAALLEEPPLCGDFCDFVMGCEPKKIVLAHLYQFSRPPGDLWHDRHVVLAGSRLESNGMPRNSICAPAFGEGFVL